VTTTVVWIFVALVSGLEAFAQVTDDTPPGGFFTPGPIPIGPAVATPLSGTGGSSRGAASFEGLLARSDGDTLSIELPDERVMRFQLKPQTRYLPDGPAAHLAAFRIADVVSVEAISEARGYFTARSVRFLRKATLAEQAELLQSPEVNYRWENNVIDSAAIDSKQDTRKLSLVGKPAALVELSGNKLPDGDALIQSIRTKVNEAFERLPNFRARLVTSMFHSSTKKAKWIPNGVITAEISYEGKEAYSEILVDGKRPANAPASGDADYMRSFNNAWSSGDFESIAHCVFDGLEDSDFHKAETEHGDQGDLVVYEFAGNRASTCIGVRSETQVAYPSYRGSLKVNAKTGDVVHAELEAIDVPKGFPLDRAERSVDYGLVQIGTERYLLPATGYWFGCYRNTYLCFMNRMDFRDYRRFSSDSVVRFAAGH
jgi:hypothetical protein